jgi:hypothetical protein
VTPVAPLYVDNSTLVAMSDCDQRALTRYHWGLTTTEERATLLAGTAAHLAVAAWLAGTPLGGTMDTLENGPVLPDGRGYRAFADDTIPADDPKSPLARFAWPNISTIMRRWCEEHPLDGLPFTIDPGLIEVGFAFPLTADGSIIYCGRLDAIVEDRESGHLYVLETKTTFSINANWLRQFRVDSQVSGYVWAAQQHVSVEGVVGAYINAIQFSKLPSDPHKKCKEHGVKFVECGDQHATWSLPLVLRSPKTIADWQQGAVTLAKQFARLKRAFPTTETIDLPQQQGRWHRSCMFCEFYDFCAVERAPALVSSMLVHAPWEPYARAFRQPDAATT